jgi:hypothetical protein
VDWNNLYWDDEEAIPPYLPDLKEQGVNCVVQYAAEHRGSKYLENKLMTSRATNKFIEELRHKLRMTGKLNLRATVESVWAQSAVTSSSTPVLMLPKEHKVMK